jgi:hypothetical protein
MNTKTRSAEIARRAIQTVSRDGGVDPKIIPLFFQEAERLAPNDAILDITETAEQEYLQSSTLSQGACEMNTTKTDDQIEKEIREARAKRETSPAFHRLRLLSLQWEQSKQKGTRQ